MCISNWKMHIIPIWHINSKCVYLIEKCIYQFEKNAYTTPKCVYHTKECVYQFEKSRNSYQFKSLFVKVKNNKQKLVLLKIFTILITLLIRCVQYVIQNHHVRTTYIKHCYIWNCKSHLLMDNWNELQFYKCSQSIKLRDNNHINNKSKNNVLIFWTKKDFHVRPPKCVLMKKNCFYRVFTVKFSNV